MIFSNGIIINMLIATILTLILYMRTRGEIVQGNRIILWLTRWIHFNTLLFLIIYIFIFDMEYDYIYLGFVLIMFASWLIFKNECIFSYIEKKQLDTEYILGNNVRNQPYIDKLVGDKYKHAFFVFIGFYTHIIFAFIVYRNVEMYIKNELSKNCIYVVLAAILVNNLYYVYKHRYYNVYMT